jgi:HK97 family phage major capsid protein
MEISNKITELQEERTGNVSRMRSILDTADADGGRDLTAEERQEYDRLEARVDANGERIKAEIKLRDMELELEQRDGVAGRELQGGESRDKRLFESEDYARAFATYLIRGANDVDADTRSILAAGSAEMRDQAKGTNNLGGYLVPTDFQKQLALHAVQAGTVRRTRVNTIVTSTGEGLQVPKTTAHGAASWVAEGVASSAADETFGQITLNAYTARRLVKVSVELVEDEAVGLIAYLGKAIGQSIGFLENDGYLNGSGTGQPTGLIGLTSAGVTGAAGQTTSVTADNVFDLFYSVGPQYRTNAEWLLADSTVKAIRKLKDSTNNYIWSPTSGVASVLANGAPDTLLGKPMWADPSMPAMTANAKSILFGDMSAYTIRDVGRTGPTPDEKPVGAFGVIRMNERYMDGLQIGFLGYHRTDGNLVDQTGAIKAYVNSAT